MNNYIIFLISFLFLSCVFVFIISEMHNRKERKELERFKKENL